LQLTRYGYSDAINGFFEFPTDNARRILPAHLEPVELHHGSSIFAMTVFEFTESEVGQYYEVVFSVGVMPLVKPGEPLPKNALYPYIVGTSTEASRLHAIERWHLPHWMQDVQVDFTRDDKKAFARVEADGAPVAELNITAHSWAKVRHLYQSFMRDQSGAYYANILMEGQQSEHEEETGSIQLFEHPFHDRLRIADVNEQPFREVWMRNGIQTFDPLYKLDV
jgi:hypothetical protein